MELIEKYLGWCARRELRPNYIQANRWTLTRLRNELGIPLERANEQQILDYWDALNVTAASRVAYGAHVSGFYRWALRERYRADDPTIRMDRPRIRRGLPHPMDSTELRRAIDYAPSPVRSFLLLAAYMGFRACEIAPLSRDDVHPKVIVIKEGKGGKQRIVPLHPTVKAELDEAPDVGWLFPSRRDPSLPMRPNTVSARANRYLHELGISDTIHSCRHWFGTNIYRTSLDLRLTQELMGHSDPKTTAGYAAWEPIRAASVVDGLTISA